MVGFLDWKSTALVGYEIMMSENTQCIASALRNSILIEFETSEKDFFRITSKDGKLYIKANNYVAAFHGLYCYLKKYCNVQLSWCGNQETHIDKLVMFDGEFKKEIEQKYRVYMNYCTLDYSMCWWDFARWEKEIDFMAMNGINMPLAVVGTEAVWYETLQEFGFTKEEVRRLAGELGVSVASRPSTPCLATRLPYGAEIKPEILEQIARGEEFLRNAGFAVVRLRLHGDIARIEIPCEKFPEFLEKREEIVKNLKNMGFSYITLDIQGFRSGSMDENL